jgi:hypothetical protein
MNAMIPAFIGLIPIVIGWLVYLSFQVGRRNQEIQGAITSIRREVRENQERTAIDLKGISMKGDKAKAEEDAKFTKLLAFLMLSVSGDLNPKLCREKIAAIMEGK